MSGDDGAKIRQAGNTFEANMKTSRSSDQSRLERHYYELSRRGQKPSLRQLLQYAQDNGLKVNKEEIKQLRYLMKYWVLHSRFVRPAAYMGPAIFKFGTVQVDMAHFRPSLAHFNRGYKAFLVGKECLSEVLWCVPCKDFTMESWEQALKKMIENTYGLGLNHFISDRDVVALSERFRTSIKKTYGINWSFLKSRSKSFRAERAIRFLKDRLSIALMTNWKKSKNWIQYIDGILDEYNSKNVTGTRIQRKTVNKSNYVRVLEQVYRTKNPEALQNIQTGSNYSPGLRKKLFRYSLGDLVVLANRANYTKKLSAFSKPSVAGSYGQKKYAITRQRMKNNGNIYLTPVYGLEGLSGLFYPSELRPAYKTVRGDSGEEEEEEGEETATEEDDEVAPAEEPQRRSQPSRAVKKLGAAKNGGFLPNIGRDSLRKR
jgi:hypothetical protein